MLLKNNISNCLIHTDSWFGARLGKITSSEFHLLMGPKGIGETGRNYLYRKVYEELSGLPSRKEISTEATEHGLMYEPENLREFGKHMGIEFLVQQKLILSPNGRVGSTPDAIWPIRESSDKTAWDVCTVEAKCPASEHFINLWNCTTPEHIKEENKSYYWQVLHQMKVCDCLKGYLSIYNPFVRAGKLRVIEFRKIDLVKEFTLMEHRTQEAIAIFTTQRDKMLSAA